MKKINILLAGLVALGMASCDDKSDLGIMQENPQEAIMEANGVQLAYGTGLDGSSINLGNYENGEIPVIRLVEAKDLPADATIYYEMQVSTDAAFSNYKTLTVTDGAVKANDWENAFLEMIGKAPYEKPNWVRFATYAKTANDLVRLGGSDFYYAEKQINVTPYDLKLPVEDAYYLVLNCQGINLAIEPIKMDHSSKHQYDDPVFSAIVDITGEMAGAGCNWIVVPASQYPNYNVDYCYGVSEVGDPTDNAGSLSLFENGAQAGLITSAGNQKIEVNMLTLDYKVSFAFDYIYTPGPANGWTFENNMLLFTDDYANYHGYVYVENEFKMTGQADWSPLDWGGDENGNLVAGGPNIKRETGLYWVNANIVDLTYATTRIESIGIIGDFNDWSGDVNMTWSDNYKTWTGTITLPKDGVWKFRCNGGWDINLGGTPDKLVPNGANIALEAGTYVVTLQLGSLPYTCTIEKQ